MKSGEYAAEARVRTRQQRRAVARGRARLVRVSFAAVFIALSPVHVSAQRLQEEDLVAPLQLAAAASAQTAASVEAEKPSPAEVDARTSYIIERLDARKKHATWWYRSWFAVYAGGFAYSTLRASLANGDIDRTDSIVSGVKSTVGIVDLLLRPIEARHGADPIRALPGETAEQRLARLETAESRLESNAERARHARDWRVHLSSVGLNLAGATALVIVGSPKRAAQSFAIGEIFSELAIFTEPVTPAQDWDDYAARRNTRTWTLVPMGMGLAFHATF